MSRAAGWAWVLAQVMFLLGIVIFDAFDTAIGTVFVIVGGSIAIAGTLLIAHLERGRRRKHNGGGRA